MSQLPFKARHIVIHELIAHLTNDSYKRAFSCDLCLSRLLADEKASIAVQVLMHETDCRKPSSFAGSTK